GPNSSLRSNIKGSYRAIARAPPRKVAASLRRLEVGGRSVAREDDVLHARGGNRLVGVGEENGGDAVLLCKLGLSEGAVIEEHRVIGAARGDGVVAGSAVDFESRIAASAAHHRIVAAAAQEAVVAEASEHSVVAGTAHHGDGG